MHADAAAAAFRPRTTRRERCRGGPVALKTPARARRGCRVSEFQHPAGATEDWPAAPLPPPAAPMPDSVAATKMLNAVDLELVHEGAIGSADELERFTRAWSL